MRIPSQANRDGGAAEFTGGTGRLPKRSNSSAVPADLAFPGSAHSRHRGWKTWREPVAVRLVDAPGVRTAGRRWQHCRRFYADTRGVTYYEQRTLLQSSAPPASDCTVERQRKAFRPPMIAHLTDTDRLPSGANAAGNPPGASERRREQLSTVQPHVRPSRLPGSIGGGPDQREWDNGAI